MNRAGRRPHANLSDCRTGIIDGRRIAFPVKGRRLKILAGVVNSIGRSPAHGTIDPAAITLLAHYGRIRTVANASRQPISVRKPRKVGEKRDCSATRPRLVSPDIRLGYCGRPKFVPSHNDIAIVYIRGYSVVKVRTLARVKVIQGLIGEQRLAKRLGCDRCAKRKRDPYSSMTVSFHFDSYPTTMIRQVLPNQGWIDRVSPKRRSLLASWTGGIGANSSCRSRARSSPCRKYVAAESKSP